MNLHNDVKITKNLKKLKSNQNFLNDLDKFLNDYENNNFNDINELKNVRKDADNIKGGTYFFDNINTYRCLLKISFNTKNVYILWFGSHDEYERTFKNNKNTIKKFIENYNNI